MSRQNKVTKYRKRKDFSVTYIVFLVFFIYIVTYVCIYMTKDHLSIYEVKEGYTADNNTFTGLILRNEAIEYSDKTGYVNYYHRDADRISKNSITHSISQEKQTYDLDSGEEVELSKSDLKSLNKEINDFKNRYEDSKFGQVYDFKYDMENLVLQVMKDNELSNIDKQTKSSKNTAGLAVLRSDSTGIITYSMDGYEDVTAKTVTKDMFEVDNYTKTSIRTTELIEEKKPVYRLVKSENWKIILPVDDSQYDKIKELKTVKVTIGDYGLETTVPITLYEVENEKYAMLSLSKYMIQFINQRYVKVELALNAASGLKIPGSSLVDKEFYMVPLEYFSEGGNSGSTGITYETYKENGDTELNFIATDIFYSDEEYGYIDERILPANSRIVSPTSGERFRLTLTDTLQGVFNVNKGYAIFRRVEVLYSNEEYCIVKTGTKYGLDVFDHIALVGTTAVEQELIY